MNTKTKALVHRVKLHQIFSIDATTEQTLFLTSINAKVENQGYISMYTYPKGMDTEWREKCEQRDAAKKDMLDDTLDEETRIIAKDAFDDITAWLNSFKIYPGKEYYLNDSQLLQCVVLGLHFTLEGTTEVQVAVDNFDIAARINELTAKFLEGLTKANDFAFNNKCQVPVPGEGLLAIKHVKVETDLCTELLQEELDRGWRILAVCPQPDKRRPDYVLGKA